MLALLLQRFTFIDLTEARLFVTFWWYWLLYLLGLLLGSFLLERMGRNR